MQDKCLKKNQLKNNPNLSIPLQTPPPKHTQLPVHLGGPMFPFHRRAHWDEGNDGTTAVCFDTQGRSELLF